MQIFRLPPTTTSSFLCPTQCTFKYQLIKESLYNFMSAGQLQGKWNFTWEFSSWKYLKNLKTNILSAPTYTIICDMRSSKTFAGMRTSWMFTNRWKFTKMDFPTLPNFQWTPFNFRPIQIKMKFTFTVLLFCVIQTLRTAQSARRGDGDQLIWAQSRVMWELLGLIL